MDTSALSSTENNDGLKVAVQAKLLKSAQNMQVQQMQQMMQSIQSVSPANLGGQLDVTR